MQTSISMSSDISTLYKLFQIEPNTKLTLFLSESENATENTSTITNNNLQIHSVISDYDLTKNDLLDDDEIKKIIKQLNNEFIGVIIFYSQSESENIIINETICVEDTENHNKQISIKRHLHSFYQTEEFMRKKIHSLINNYINDVYTNNNCQQFSSCIFLGGEMYIYGNLFNELFKQKIYITDIESIHQDAMLNDIAPPWKQVVATSPYKSKYILTSYYPNDFLLNLFSNTNTNIDVLISNMSKTGLGENICNQIGQIKPKYLILITCNFKVTMRDINLLKKYANYNLINIIKLKTTYETFVSFLVC
jgi:hypothetical protein